MKLLIEPVRKDNLYLDKADGIILPLEGFSVESICYFNIDEIINIKKNNKCLVFVKINKNLFNDEIDKVKDILIRLNDCSIDGVFFYDLAVLQLKIDNKLDIDLIWSQTHMVNNYVTCNYYYDKGCKYALLGKEITLDEILEIISKSKIIAMVEVVGRPSVGFSKRKLVSNYYSNLGINGDKSLRVLEKVTSSYYDVIEDDNGTCFYLDVITNGTSIIKSLYDGGCEFIIYREYGVPDFGELVSDTVKYINGKCLDEKFILKYKKLGDSTNFFFKKTIYRVK